MPTKDPPVLRGPATAEERVFVPTDPHNMGPLRSFLEIASVPAADVVPGIANDHFDR